MTGMGLRGSDLIRRWVAVSECGKIRRCVPSLRQRHAEVFIVSAAAVEQVEKACEITLLARSLDATEIERLGLANKVVPHESLLEETSEWARELAANPPLAVAAAKRSMRLGLDATFEANSHHVMAELMQLFRTEDFREGLAAFLEKRAPRFQGR